MERKVWYQHSRFDPASRAEWQSSVAKDHPEVNAVYPPGFWKEYARFCAGDHSKLNMAVAFLLSDPWVFGSGCVKEDFIHAILHMELSEDYIVRLQQVVLSVVDRRDGREFRDYCRLARKMDSPKLRGQLTQRLTYDDPNVRRRARWVLEALDSHISNKIEP